MCPAISVIIPIYKSEKYLAQCIESVLNQTFRDFELILVDDGSPDSSGQICDDFKQKDERVRVVHKSNGGVSTARNEGLKIAGGEYITFVDSDDYIDEGLLEFLYRQTKEQLADMVVTGLMLEAWENDAIKETTYYKIQNTKTYSPRELLEGWGQEFPYICMCGPCCKLYNADIIRDNNLLFDVNLSRGEDTSFNFDVLSKIKKIYFCEEMFYHYRFASQDSLFRRFRNDIYEIQCVINEKQMKLMTDLNCNKSAIYQHEVRCVTTLLGEIHGHFKFHEQNTSQERMNIVRKVSNNQRVKTCKIRRIKGLKNKILVLLLKGKRCKMVLKIFERYYINRK